jgi:hypothetical protein
MPAPLLCPSPGFLTIVTISRHVQYTKTKGNVLVSSYSAQLFFITHHFTAWMQRMRELSQTYRDPASVPGGVPMVPGTTELRTSFHVSIAGILTRCREGLGFMG